MHNSSNIVVFLLLQTIIENKSCTHDAAVSRFSLPSTHSRRSGDCCVAINYSLELIPVSWLYLHPHLAQARVSQRHQPLHLALGHGNATVAGGKSPDIQACKKSGSSRAPEALVAAQTHTSCVSSQKPLIREYMLLFLLLLLLLSRSLALDCVPEKRDESSSFPIFQCSTALLNPRFLCL